MVSERNIPIVEKMMDETSMWVCLAFHKWQRFKGYQWSEGRQAWWNGMVAIPHQKLWEEFLAETTKVTEIK